MGVITMGKILMEYGFLDSNVVNLRSSESRGVSQREGSVFSYIKFQMGDHQDKLSESSSKFSILSPSPKLQSIHLMIALDSLEMIRNLHYLKDNGTIFLNTNTNIPKSCLTHEDSTYPDLKKVLKNIKEIYPKVKIIKNNYTKKALEQTNRSIMANKFILQELPLEYPQIFDKKLFSRLLHKFFS